MRVHVEIAAISMRVHVAAAMCGRGRSIGGVTPQPGSRHRRDPLRQCGPTAVHTDATRTMNKGFLRAGHLPTLFAAFLYFDLSFMVWVILGPLGVQIAKDLGLDAAQKGLMVATPVLAGALLRIVMGVLVDHIGPKWTGALAQIVVIGGLLAAWFFGVHAFRRPCWWALYSVLPGPPSRWLCRSRRAGTRRSIKALHSASPGPAIRARCWPRCWRRASQSFADGKTS
jgi:hypothetical protein